MFLPGVVGGDVLRVFYGMVQVPEQKTRLTISVICDRYIGLCALLFVGGIAGIAYGYSSVDNNKILVFYFSIILLFAFVLSLIIPIIISIFTNKLIYYLKRKSFKRINKFIYLTDNINKMVMLIYKFPKAILIAFLISLIVHLKDIYIMYLLAEIMNFNLLTFNVLCLIGVLTLLVNILPFTPAGIGLGELTFGMAAKKIIAGGSTPYSSLLLVFRILKTICLLPAIFLLFIKKRDVNIITGV